MSKVINYFENDFPISYNYDDTDEHIIKISKNVVKLNVKGDNTETNEQIIQFNSGIALTEILTSSFVNCSSLKDVVLQDNVKIIHKSAFRNCSDLSNLTMGIIYGIDDYAFQNSGIEKLFLDLRSINENYPYEGCEKVELSNGPFIGKGVFQGCKNLKEVILCTSTELGDNMFEGCTSLSSVIFANHGQCVGDCAFANCTSLKQITLPENFEIISYGMFQGCENLEQVIIPDSSTKFVSIESRVFENTNNLTSLVVPKTIDNINLIERDAFLSSNIQYLKLNGIHSEILDKYLQPEEESVNFNPIKFTGEFTYGTWYYGSTELMDFIKRNNIPAAMIRCGPGCGRCTLLERYVLTNPDFDVWVKSQTIAFVYYFLDKYDMGVEPVYFYPTPKEIWNKTLKRYVTSNFISFPGYSQYWLKKDGTLYRSNAYPSGNVNSPERISSLKKTFSRNFDSYEPDPKFISSNNISETDKNLFSCFGVKNGCVVESSNGKQYTWNASLNRFTV